MSVVPSQRGGSLEVSEKRRTAALQVAELLQPGSHVAITTHVNADGDGCGSEVALWHLLTAHGVDVVLANPTPIPSRYRFLLSGIEHADKTAKAVKQLDAADAVVVVDIADLGRLGHLAQRLRERAIPVACIDHHLSDGSLPAGPRMVDATACATGELVYDLASALNWELGLEAARALYVAILTDTGGFRYSNTTARSLRIAAELIEWGIDPEEVYLEVYAGEPEGKIRLLAEVVDTLVVDSDLGIAWVTVPPGALERNGVEAEHLEGIVDLPRSIRGTRLAMLFRPLANGRTKVSFRSVGKVNAAALAEQFGGGGHFKAAGASIEGDLVEVQQRVVQAARKFLSDGTSEGNDGPHST